MSEFKPHTTTPPEPPLANEEIIQQVGTGAVRHKQTVEVGEMKSKNYVPGQQGWKVGETTAEFNQGATIGGWVLTGTTIQSTDGYIQIDSANKRILINDGTDNRIIIGYQLNGF